MKYRWQHTLLPFELRPKDAIDEGWRALGDDGAWYPVSVHIRHLGPAIFWRRKLTRSKVVLAPDFPDNDKTEQWAVKAATADAPADLLQGMVLSCISSVVGKDPNPKRCATSAKQVLSLWRALGWPDVECFGVEFRLIARASHDCPDPLFARDIRAEGWDEGRDRSRDISTLCVQKKYDERYRVANEWALAGFPTRNAAKVQRPRETPTNPQSELPSMRSDRER